MVQHRKRHITPVSVRLEEGDVSQLEQLEERYPLYSRNKMIRAAIRHWGGAALKHGLDANLQPIKNG